MVSTIPELPSEAPKPGEQFRHYKGGHYEVILVALHSNDHKWMIVYRAREEKPAMSYFTRPLHEWDERIEWGGQFVRRFTRIDA